MFKKNHLVILVIICGIITSALPSNSVRAAGELNFTVDTTIDAADSNLNDNECIDTGGHCSLRTAIQQAIAHPGDDTITVPAGMYNLTLTGADSGSPSSLTDYANNAGVGDFDIYSNSDTITITGAGSASTIINASTISDRIFDVITNSVLTVSGVTIKNGSTTSAGGGMKCVNSTVTLIDVIISYNTSTASAGGLNSSNCSLTFSHTTFDHNTAVNDGGAAYISVSSGNTISITDGEFTHNTSNRLGGAIEFNQISGSQYATLNRVTFANNSSTGGGTTGGGALEVYAGVQITNGTFIDNSSDTLGGAIEVPNNAAARLVLAQSTIIQNTAGTRGGGISVGGLNATVQLRGNLIAANTATNIGQDCYAIYGFTSLDYNFVGDKNDCDFNPETHDDVTTGARSYMATAELGDNGGSIQTVRMYGPETLDIVPSGSCTDAAGAALSVDARGMVRAQNTNCDRGAYEKDQANPTVTVTAGTDTVECATGTWINAGATASDNFSTSLTASTSDTVNVNTLGVQTITYTSAADADGNTGTATRTVTVRDTTAPVITVTGNTSITHEGATSYTDAGATASDACDSSVSVITTGSISITTLGAQTLTYTTSDDSTNTAIQKTRTVTVVDTTAPVLTLVGEDHVTLNQGDTYTDAGATATDSFQGDVTSSIVTTNPVDVNTPGDYTITYAVSDSSGNTAIAITRTVTVAAVTTTSVVTTNGKVVNLLVDGIQVDRLKIGKKKLARTYYKIKTVTFFSDYDNVIVLTAGKHSAKLTVARITADHHLEKIASKTFAIANRTALKLKATLSKKQIITRVGKGKTTAFHTWIVKKTGQLYEK